MPWLDHDPPKQPTLKGAIPRDEGIAIGIIDNRDNDSALLRYLPREWEK